jgi:uncharacterized protein YbaR (Trm112 family)
MGSTEALKERPDLFRKWFGKVIPTADNKFSALNSAVFSGGSFIYVPPGVKVKHPLQAYFRINAVVKFGAVQPSMYITSAIKLGFHSRKEFPFVLRNSQALESLLNRVRNLIPRTFCCIARSEITTDQIKVYFLELVACPMRRQRLAVEHMESIFAELADPLRLPFHLDDVIDRLLCQANTPHRESV